MVSGRLQSVDNAFIKANASMDSLIEKEVIEDAGVYAEELKQNNELQITAYKKHEVEQRHKRREKETSGTPGSCYKEGKEGDGGEYIQSKFLSNETHYSPTDPDARISTKPGKPRNLNYLAQVSVDTMNHVITGAMAASADKRNSQHLPSIVKQTLKNLGEHDLIIEQLLADKGYRSSEKACKHCPLRAKCCGEKGKFKQIEVVINRDCYDRMHEKLTKRKLYAQQLFRQRSSTVEPVLGTLINYGNMKRVNTRGIQLAKKNILMATLTCNLKKYMKFISKKTVTRAITLPKGIKPFFSHFFDAFWLIFYRLKTLFFETENPKQKNCFC
jgi:hypothetical protein